MRLFEFVLLLVVTILPFVKRRLIRITGSGTLLLSLGFLAVLHLIVEGYRWQMIPVYVLILFLGWRIHAVHPDLPARLTISRLTGYAAATILIVLGWTLPMVLPVFSLPEPSGNYSVGTEQILLKTDMNEPTTDDPSDTRELMVKIWYPSETDGSDHESEKYVDTGSRAGFATKYGLSPSMLSYLDYVDTHVYPGIPVAEGSFPVLLFSHGYGSKATGYYALLSEIASRGYIIVNMNHTGESLGATFPDGRITYFDYGYQQRISSGSMDLIEPVIEAFQKGLPYEERHPIVRNAALEYFEGRVQDRWAEDMIHVLDQLKLWNDRGFLMGRLDLDRIGVFGHSVGGGAAGNLSMKDSRIKAAANLDGIQWGTRIDSLSRIPFLYMSADWPEDHEDINAHIYKNKSTDVFYETRLLNSGHPNFMDIPFMIPVRSLAGTGTIDPYLGMEIINGVVTSFFDKHLKQQPNADPVTVAAQFEVLEMIVHRGDSLQGMVEY